MRRLASILALGLRLSATLRGAGVAAIGDDGPHPSGIDNLPYDLTGTVTPVHDPAFAYDPVSDAYYIMGTQAGNGNLIPILSSKSLTGPWARSGAVFSSLPAWARRAVPGASGIWAPDVSWSATAQRWRVYYAVSTFGSQVSAIGLASSPSLDPRNASYGWRDDGLVTASNASLPYNTIDPSLFVDATGGEWLTLGSFWQGIQVIAIDPATGLPAAGAKVTNVARRTDGGGAIEASFAVYQPSSAATGGAYFLFVSFDKCCAGNASTYNVRVGRATAPAGPYADRAGMAMTAGGGTYLVGHRINGWAAGGGQSVLRAGPGGAVNSHLVLHAYDSGNGAPWATISPITWGADGWPAAWTA